MKVRSGLLALALTVLWSAAASALPPPKTDAEMLALADLVVDAKGITVVCDGAPIVTAQKTVTNYLSTLYPSKSYKGGNPKSFQIRGKTETWVGTPPVGGWFQEAVPEGWAGKLYLKKESDGTYSKVWWNANIEDKSISAPKQLPQCAAAGDGGVPDSGPVDTGVEWGWADDITHAEGGPGKDAAPVADSSPGVEWGSDDISHAEGGTTPPPVEDDGGCSCSAGGGAGGAPLGLALALLGLTALRRRRA